MAMHPVTRAGLRARWLSKSRDQTDNEGQTEGSGSQSELPCVALQSACGLRGNVASLLVLLEWSRWQI